MKHKKWFLQRYVTDNIIAAAQNLCYYLKIKVGTRYLYRKIRYHPEYPSSNSLSDFFKSLNIDSIATHIDINKIKEVPLPALALMNNHNKQLVMIHKITDDSIEYLDFTLGWITELLNEFEKKWTGDCFIVINPKKSEIINHYNKVNEKVIKNFSCKTNKIKIYKNFLTEQECNYLIALAKPLLINSHVVLLDGRYDLSNEADKDYVSKYRTSSSAFLVKEDIDPIVHSVKQKVAQILRIPLDYFEYVQCTYYKAGQQYKSHLDAFTFKNDKEILEGGNRACTFVVYLNDNFSGGGTHFPELDMVVEPKKGTAVRFFLLDAYGNPDRELLHAGLPVIEGEKFILNVWIRDQVYNARLERNS